MIAVDCIEGRRRGKQGRGGEEPVSKHSTIFSLGGENQQDDAGRRDNHTLLTRRDSQILRRKRGQEKKIKKCPADHEQDWQPCRLMLNLLLIDYPYIHAYTKGVHYQTRRVMYILSYTNILYQ